MARQDIVWVIDDDRSIRWVLEKALSQADMTVKSFDSANEIAELLDRQRPDVVISDIRMPGISGLELLKTIHAKAPEIPVIIITAHTDPESAVASYRGGAFEYLPKPFAVDEALRLVQRAIEHRRRQGIGRARPAQPQPARRQHLCRDQYRRHPERATGIGIVRPRKRCLHRRHGPAQGPVRTGQR